MFETIYCDTSEVNKCAGNGVVIFWSPHRFFIFYFFFINQMHRRYRSVRFGFLSRRRTVKTASVWVGVDMSKIDFLCSCSRGNESKRSCTLSIGGSSIFTRYLSLKNVSDCIHVGILQTNKYLDIVNNVYILIRYIFNIGV